MEKYNNKILIKATCININARISIIRKNIQDIPTTKNPSFLNKYIRTIINELKEISTLIQTLDKSIEATNSSTKEILKKILDTIPLILPELPKYITVEGGKRKHRTFRNKIRKNKTLKQKKPMKKKKYMK